MFSFELIVLIIIFVLGLLLLIGATMTMKVGYTIAETGEGNGYALDYTFSQTGENVILKTWTVPESTTDEENEITFTVASLKMITIVSTRDITIKENSSGSPTATLNLKANVPYEWHKDGGVACPHVGTAGIVTKFFITNGVGGAATVKVRGLAA